MAHSRLPRLTALALALGAHRALGAPMPTVLLRNAAQDGVFMPAIGLGTGAYGSNPNTARPECWSVAQCPGVAYNATLAYITVAQAMTPGALIRIDAANNYQDEGRAGGGAAIAASGVPRSSLFVVTKVRVVSHWACPHEAACAVVGPPHILRALPWTSPGRR